MWAAEEGGSAPLLTENLQIEYFIAVLDSIKNIHTLYKTVHFDIWYILFSKAAQTELIKLIHKI